MVFNRQTKRLEWWGERSLLVSVLGRGLHYSCLWFRAEPGLTIGGLGGSVWSWSSFVSWPVVVVEVMLAVSAVAVVPLQLKYKTSRLLLWLYYFPVLAYLGFECVVLLWEIFLSVMVWVPPPVAPLECLVGGDVYVLEIIVRSIASLSRCGQSNWCLCSLINKIKNVASLVSSQWSPASSPSLITGGKIPLFVLTMPPVCLSCKL